MKISLHIFLILLVSSFTILTITTNAEISGYVKNNAGQGLEGKVVEVHLTNNWAGGIHQTWYHTTNQQGRFAADPTTTDIDDIIPENYQIDAPYPNPFNPSTTITVPVKEQGRYELVLIDAIGQQIATFNEELNSGIHRFTIQQPGAAGIYIYGFKGKDGMISSNKLVYLGGATKATEIITHKDERELPLSMMKITDEAFTLDSIKIRGDAIQTKTFPFNIQTNGIYDVGDLLIDSAFVNINGKIYNLFDWQQQNNGIEGATIKIGTREAITDVNGNFQILMPTGPNIIKIQHPQYYTRETELIFYNDAEITDNLVSKQAIPDSVYEYNNVILGRKDLPNFGNQTRRWKNPPIFYIVVDTNTTEGMAKYLQQKAKIDTVIKPLYTTTEYPNSFLENAQIETGTNPPAPLTEGYYVIEWDPNLPSLGISGAANRETGEIYYAITTYKNFDPTTIERITVKELTTGLSGTTRYNNLPSLWNISVDWENRNGGPYDKKIIEWQYSRPGGNKIEDKDNGWYRWENQ